MILAEYLSWMMSTSHLQTRAPVFGRGTCCLLRPSYTRAYVRRPIWYTALRHTSTRTDGRGRAATPWRWRTYDCRKSERRTRASVRWPRHAAEIPDDLGTRRTTTADERTYRSLYLEPVLPSFDIETSFTKLKSTFLSRHDIERNSVALR